MKVKWLVVELEEDQHPQKVKVIRGWAEGWGPSKDCLDDLFNNLKPGVNRFLLQTVEGAEWQKTYSLVRKKYE